MRSFRILSASALVALLAFGCAHPVDDSVEPLADAPSVAPQAEPEAVLSFVNGAATERLTADGDLSPEEASALVEWRKVNGAFESLDQVTRALDSAPRNLMSNPMCSYYQGLAQYYSIRALQCAYSACYAMSPWYGYLAQYYSTLAQSVCPTVEPA